MPAIGTTRRYPPRSPPRSCASTLHRTALGRSRHPTKARPVHSEAGSFASGISPARRAARNPRSICSAPRGVDPPPSAASSRASRLVSLTRYSASPVRGGARTDDGVTMTGPPHAGHGVTVPPGIRFPRQPQSTDAHSCCARTDPARQCPVAMSLAMGPEYRADGVVKIALEGRDYPSCAFAARVARTHCVNDAQAVG